MPTILENKTLWDGTYHWKDAGEEWSHEWGTSSLQWYGTILPRICTFLPANKILEIAPGYGRWTRFLKDLCSDLLLVDLSERCMRKCQERFANCSNITYFVNDGRSLEMIPDNSIDFIFSFDSLVHVEDDVILGYLSQFPRVLKQNGVAFIHHSNLGEYIRDFEIYNKIQRYPKLLSLLLRLGIVDNIKRPMRAPSMTAKKMQQYANENGMQCISQELITWKTKRSLIDCISTMVKDSSIWVRDNKVFKNFYFMKEAENLANLSQLYDYQSKE